MKPFDPRLLRAVPTARRPFAILAIVGVLQGIATIATAFALASLVVAVVRGMPLATPAAWTAGLLGARAVLALIAERVQARAGVAVAASLRTLLLGHWLTSTAEQRPAPNDAATLAAQGAGSVEPYAARYLPALVAGAVVPVLALGALVSVDWVSALIVALTLPLLPFFAALIGASTQDDTQKRWRALSALSGHFLDVMRGLPTLVVYGRAERQVETVEEVSQRHRRATMRTLKQAFMSSSSLELLASISVAIVAVTVGLRLTHGSMTLSAGLTAILLAPEAYWPIRRVGAEFHSAADGAQAIDAILDAVDSPNASQTPSVSSAKSGSLGEVGVSISALTYSYPGSTTPVLDGVNLSAGPGLTVITGTSGVGKSTLLDVIAGLRTPQAGTIAVGGVHYVTQSPFLAPMSLRENLILGNDASDEQVWDVLRMVGLDGLVARLPRALDTLLGDDGFGLSAGQRARVTIARALLSAQPVLLLDEPTAHLDPEASALIDDVIVEVAQRRTVIAVTHRPSLVTRADQHLNLSHHAGRAARTV